MDKSYGSSAQSVDAEGNVMQGVTFYDEGLGPVDTGYTSGSPAFHVVQTGDTLWAIAKRYLGDPYQYPALAKLSRIHDPNWIYPGDVVRIIKK